MPGQLEELKVLRALHDSSTMEARLAMSVRFSKFERMRARSTFNLSLFFTTLPTGYLCPEPQRNRNSNYVGCFAGSSGHPWRIQRFSGFGTLTGELLSFPEHCSRTISLSLDY